MQYHTFKNCHYKMKSSLSLSIGYGHNYELSRLDTILDGYTSIGCSDKRLDDQCTLRRGCGRVAILWRNRLHVTPVSNISTDRFQAIQIPYLNTQVLSIVGVYLPSSDHPVQEYVDCLAELESVISALQADGPVIIMGDFNAHLGNMDNSNQVGELLFDVVCRCNLYVASILDMATGANYTYSNGPHHTTVDYCILDCGLAPLVQSCTILHPNVLNLSDHLPITVNLNLQTPTTATPLYKPKFNWRHGVENGSVEAFAADVTNFMSSLLQAPIPSSLEELDQEIIYVGKMLHGNTVPVYKKKKKKFYYDESLAKNVHIIKKYGKMLANHDQAFYLRIYKNQSMT